MATRAATIPRRILPEIEIPKTLFIDHVSPPLAIDWPTIYPSSFNVPLAAAGATIIEVSQYRKVNVLVGQTKASSASLTMGKLSGTTLGARFELPLDQKIHSFDVVGPELWLELMCPFDRKTPAEHVQLWLFLTS